MLSLPQPAQLTLAWQILIYAVVLASILSSRFLDMIRNGVPGQFFVDWKYLLFVAIVSLQVFPVAYDKAKLERGSTDPGAGGADFYNRNGLGEDGGDFSRQIALSSTIPASERAYFRRAKLAILADWKVSDPNSADVSTHQFEHLASGRF